MAYNALFYNPGRLPPGAYRSWLLANGVSFVALATAPLDYAATTEAALLRSGAARGLHPVWRSAHWELWSVVGSPGLTSGPARFLSLTPQSAAYPDLGPGPEPAEAALVSLLVTGAGPAAEVCLSRRRGVGPSSVRPAHAKWSSACRSFIPTMATVPRQQRTIVTERLVIDG